MSAAPRRRLSSLAKTAIVAAMLLIVAGLLTTAVLKVREAANLALCANNLKQIGIAAHDYHSAFDRFPPGWYGPNPDSRDYLQASNHGVLQQLQPRFLSDSLYKRFLLNHDVQARTDTQIDPKSGVAYYPPTDWPWWTLALPEDIKLYRNKGDREPEQLLPAGTHSNYFWAMTRIKMLHCPSDDPYSSTEGTFVALHTYGPDAPNNFLHGRVFLYDRYPDARELGRTNYVGVAGCAGKGNSAFMSRRGQFQETWDQFEGVFTNRSMLTLSQMNAADGPSNTLMFGETLGGVQPSETGGVPVRRYSLSWLCGALPTYYGLHGPDTGPWYAFSSRHRNVVQFVTAGGSVVGLKREMPTTRTWGPAGKTSEVFSRHWWLLQERAGWRDGGLMPTLPIHPDE